MKAVAQITTEEVRSAQADWGAGVVHIGAAPSWEEAHARATAFVQARYRCDGSLLFCPTRAQENQFRRTVDDVVSYFVGRNSVHLEDEGFALAPWVSVRFENAGIVSRGAAALAMGNYFFGRSDGSELKAEFSFVYTRGETGTLCIDLHHSALPFGH